jgi:predicted aminopeptidase
MKALRALAIVGAAVALSGCGAADTADYYWQSASGQLDIMARAKPIDVVIGESPDPALKQRLLRVQEIRAFASRELGLPANASYTRYADLERPFVVWNVFAAPELSLKGRQWCFPIAGCVSYRGYFSEKEARAEAARLAAQGDDVWVAGVPAYSTLGYFDDPVLSTFVRWPELEVARMVFHELAHQVVYVKDDSQFNESFAVAVEDAGVRRWIAAQADPRLIAQYERTGRLRDAFRDLTRDARRDLAQVYASDASDASTATLPSTGSGPGPSARPS